LLLALLGAGLLVGLGCASGSGDSPIRRGILGAWTNERVLEKKGVVGHISTRSSPFPYRLTFRADGTFQALYSPKQLARVDRAIGSQKLTSPLEGRYEIDVDLLGVAWIEMRPGAPKRRVSLEKGRLVLHKVGQSWTAEKYRRER